MGTVAVIGLLLLSIILFVSVRKRWIDDKTLQTLANIAAIVALIGTALVFIVPAATQPTSTLTITPTTAYVQTSTQTLAATATLTPLMPEPTSMLTNTPPATTTEILCSYTGVFAPIWQSNVDRLGCPIGNEIVTGNGASQSFVGGQMYWVDVYNRIYVFSYSGSWLSVSNDWASGEPVFSCDAGRNANIILGFGKAWCDNVSIQSMMGQPTANEQPTPITVSVFEKGLIFEASGIKRLALNTNVWEEK